MGMNPDDIYPVSASSLSWVQTAALADQGRVVAGQVQPDPATIALAASLQAPVELAEVKHEFRPMSTKELIERIDYFT